MFTHAPVKSVFFIILPLIYVTFSVPATSPAMTGQTEAALKQTISTLAKARNNLVSRHEADLSVQQIRTSERKEFLVFISYLDGRIHHYCLELYNNFGQESLLGLECPKNTAESDELSQYTPVPQITEPTNDQKIANLNENFEKSLNQFDDMLLTEQGQIAQKQPKQREKGASANSSTGRKGKRNEPNSISTQPNSTDNTKGNTEKKKTPKTSGNKDLSQNDDDIVAKQLREAAEKETDPEIKAKLWEEYKKYKEGTN